MNWKEFRPTILFLGKFIGCYIIGNLLYGWYVTSFEPEPDPATRFVTEQTSWVLTKAGWATTTYDLPNRPTTVIIHQNKSIVSVYEGCNGINVAIIFVSFLVAFGPRRRELAWFIPVGLLIIHISNIVRILLLFEVTLYLPRFLYFTHKYLFTGIIYAVVFVMWLYWVRVYGKKTS